MHVRVCPRCGEEYRPEIVACADCGTVLVDADDEAPGPLLPAAPAAAPEPTEDVARLYRAAQPRDLAPLADALVAADMPFQIQYDAETRSYYLTVPESLEQAAADLLARVAAAEPDALFDAMARPLSEDDAEAKREALKSATACPACGTRVAPEADDCPACGLHVGRVEREDD
jgi:hypothetical protein